MGACRNAALLVSRSLHAIRNHYGTATVLTISEKLEATAIACCISHKYERVFFLTAPGTLLPPRKPCALKSCALCALPALGSSSETLGSGEAGEFSAAVAAAASGVSALSAEPGSSSGDPSVMLGGLLDHADIIPATGAV